MYEIRKLSISASHSYFYWVSKLGQVITGFSLLHLHHKHEKGFYNIIVFSKNIFFSLSSELSPCFFYSILFFSHITEHILYRSENKGVGPQVIILLCAGFHSVNYLVRQCNYLFSSKLNADPHPLLCLCNLQLFFRSFTSWLTVLTKSHVNALIRQAWFRKWTVESLTLLTGVIYKQ